MNMRSPLASWPEPPPGPALSVRDVALLDLARYVARQTPFPLDDFQADTDDLWNHLKMRADELGPSFDRDAVLDELKPEAMAWAEQRAAERRIIIGE